MTTKVTVDAHAGWPVRVVAQDKAQDGSVYHTELGIVPPNEKRDFYVHSTRDIIVSEMEKS